jgi:hypothetical protein
MKCASIFSVLLGVFAIFTSIAAEATPAQVVIIRHGEKPAVGNELDQQGCERAYLLPNFLMKNSTVLEFGIPKGIYAMAPKSKKKKKADPTPDPDAGTLRPIETIAPTAEDFHLTIHDQFTKADGAAAAAKIMSTSKYDGRTVIMSWEHAAIPALAQQFGLTLPTYAQTWPDDVFDEAWVLTFASDGTVSLTISPEQVLSTDNPNGGANWTQNPNATSTAAPVVPSEIAAVCETDHDLDAIASGLITVSVKGLTASRSVIVKPFSPFR